MGRIVDMPDGVAVGSGMGIKGSIIAAGTPPVVRLGYDFSAEDEERSERQAVPFRNMASNSALVILSRSGASHRDRHVTGGPDMVRLWWTVLWRISRWTPAERVRFENSASTLSIAVPPMMFLTLGISALAAWSGTENDLTPSSSYPYLF
jgi:hypothetical protein